MTNLFGKIFIPAGLIFLGILLVWFFVKTFQQPAITWGVSFDPYYAIALGLDPQQTYTELLDDLQVSDLRLTAHWDKIEPVRGTYDWSVLDWQMVQAGRRGRKIVLTVGQKLPRWPECYRPAWVNSLSAEEQEAVLIAFIKATIERYRDTAAIKWWQVENEPIVGWFGEGCPAPDVKRLEREVALVRLLDSRPIMITDSGELSLWLTAARQGDILGATLYRTVWNKRFGYIKWFLPPSYYWLKTALVKQFTGVEKIIVSELQTEPWSPTGKVTDLSAYERDASMSTEQLQNNLTFTAHAGFDTVYLWGAEWWYWMKTIQHDDRYWEITKQLWVK